jgi:hypothetical protein
MALKNLIKGNIGQIIFGIIIGIVISHVFRSSVDNVWGMIPGLNTIKANYGYAYY